MQGVGNLRLLSLLGVVVARRCVLRLGLQPLQSIVLLHLLIDRLEVVRALHDDGPELGLGHCVCFILPTGGEVLHH